VGPKGFEGVFPWNVWFDSHVTIFLSASAFCLATFSSPSAVGVTIRALRSASEMGALDGLVMLSVSSFVGGFGCSASAGDFGCSALAGYFWLHVLRSPLLARVIDPLRRLATDCAHMIRIFVFRDLGNIQ
jgi:hypothetical protein